MAKSVKPKKSTPFSFNYDKTVNSHIEYVKRIEEKRANNQFSLVVADPDSFQAGLTVPPISPQIPGKSLEPQQIYPKVSMTYFYPEQIHTSILGKQ